MDDLLLELKHVNLTLGGVKILSDINWRVRELESWAVLGGNGAGKSTLLRLALGEVWPDQQLNADPEQPESEIAWYIAGTRESSPIAAKQVVASVSPELHNWYMEHGWNLSGEELILSGFYASPLLYNDPVPEEQAEARALAEELGLTHLLDHKVAEMSQGQLRNMLVARALIARPLLLALDEVFDGLDSEARQTLSALLEHLSGFESTILITAHRLEDLPSFIKHALVLEHGKIIAQGPLDEVKKKSDDFSPPPILPDVVAPPVNYAEPPFLQLKNVNVFLERKQVLHNINWIVEKGEHWAVLGENGSGKTTLLRCIWGEEHHAFGGTLAWFGDPGPHNRQELHLRLGLVSDRLQAAVPPELLVEDLVVSGFSASLDLYENPLPGQRARASELMDDMGLAALTGRRAGTLSYGQLRRVLLARALVHKPILLLLDEPCSGLDNASREAFLDSLAQAAHSGSTQIIHITHRTDDLAGITTHALYLEQGRVSYCGPYPRVEQA